MRNQEYSLQNMMADDTFGEVYFHSTLSVKLNFQTQIETTTLSIRVFSKQNKLSSSPPSPFHFPMLRRKESKISVSNFLFSSFYPTRNQIKNLYKKIFKIQEREIFTEKELSALSNMSVSESFNPNGQRIVTQGSLLKDLYVLTCGECDVVCVSSEKSIKSSDTPFVARKEGWVLKKRSGWYVFCLFVWFLMAGQRGR